MSGLGIVHRVKRLLRYELGNHRWLDLAFRKLVLNILTEYCMEVLISITTRLEAP